jgi:signal transduction histidine kinase
VRIEYPCHSPGEQGWFILHLQIEDHGSGFDIQASLSASTFGGLSGMHDRASLLGDSLAIESAPGAGTHLTAELPLRGRVEGRKRRAHDDDRAGG